MIRVTIESLREFNQVIGFWYGAKDRWESYTEEEIDYLEELVSDYDFESLTQVNDFIWFESDDLLEEWHQERRDAELWHDNTIAGGIYDN